MYANLCNFEIPGDYKITKRKTDDGEIVRIAFGKQYDKWFSEDLVLMMDKKKVFEFATELIKKAKLEVKNG